MRDPLKPIHKWLEQIVCNRFFYNPITMEEAAQQLGLKLEWVRGVFDAKRHHWENYGKFVEHGEGRLEFIPDDRWFRWAKNKPDENATEQVRSTNLGVTTR
ncbi:MAG: hypothetical protein ABSH52_13415 [Terriglobia bacterium]